MSLFSKTDCSLHRMPTKTKLSFYSENCPSTMTHLCSTIPVQYNTCIIEYLYSTDDDAAVYC